MKNKNARIEIRLPEEIKNKLQKIALEKNISTSELIYSLILNLLEEEKNSGQFN